MTAATRVLLISHDVVGQSMAGPGIRMWELAQVLSQHYQLTLLAPQPIDLTAAFAHGAYAWGSAGALQPWLAQADCVIANGFVLQAHPELARVTRPLALDLYDPVLLEDLEASRSVSPEQRDARNALQRDLLQRQLQAGDCFVCATERQRDLYIGGLMALGRITPAQTDADPLLRSLIDVAPFGLPATPPHRTGAGLRGVLPGIGSDDLVLLWTGGLWDWLDPLTLLDALPTVVERMPQLRLVFLAGRHPGAISAMHMPARAREHANQLGLLNRHVFFYETWVPYAARMNLLLDADIAVTLHRDHLETRYAAVRSRFLDHLWAGLPSLVTAGDAAAELVTRHGLGQVAQPADSASVASALLQLLEHPDERAACGERARMLAQQFTWEQAAQPLLRFCANPHSSPTRQYAMTQSNAYTPSAQLSREGAMPDLTAFKAAVALLHEHWQLRPSQPASAMPLLGPAKRLAMTLTRWYVDPLVEQQNQFNATVVHAVQQLATITEQLASDQAPIHQHIADIEQHLLDIDDAQTAMAHNNAIMPPPTAAHHQ